MGNTVLPVVTTCRDLSITVTNDLAPSQHINDITVKAHRRANSILRCFVTKDTAVLLRAYTVYVRPILEYNCVVWSPHLKQDIDCIEKVQRRFTKRLPNLRHFSYNYRLSALDLPMLEQRAVCTEVFERVYLS